MAPVLDLDWDPEKKIYAYCFLYTIKHHGHRATKESICGLVVAAENEAVVTQYVRNRVVNERLTGLVGAVEYTRIVPVSIQCLDIDEIAVPLGHVSESYRQEVFRLIEKQKQDAA